MIKTARQFTLHQLFLIWADEIGKTTAEPIGTMPNVSKTVVWKRKLTVEIPCMSCPQMDASKYAPLAKKDRGFPHNHCSVWFADATRGKDLFWLGKQILTLKLKHSHNGKVCWIFIWPSDILPYLGPGMLKTHPHPFPLQRATGSWSPRFFPPVKLLHTDANSWNLLSGELTHKSGPTSATFCISLLCGKLRLYPMHLTQATINRRVFSVFYGLPVRSKSAPLRMQISASPCLDSKSASGIPLLCSW